MNIEAHTPHTLCARNTGETAFHLLPTGAKAVLLLSVLCAGLMGCVGGTGTGSPDGTSYEADMSDLDGLAIFIPGL